MGSIGKVIYNDTIKIDGFTEKDFHRRLSPNANLGLIEKIAQYVVSCVFCLGDLFTTGTWNSHQNLMNKLVKHYNKNPTPDAATQTIIKNLCSELSSRISKLSKEQQIFKDKIFTPANTSTNTGSSGPAANVAGASRGQSNASIPTGITGRPQSSKVSTSSTSGGDVPAPQPQQQPSAVPQTGDAARLAAENAAREQAEADAAEVERKAAEAKATKERAEAEAANAEAAKRAQAAENARAQREQADREAAAAEAARKEAEAQAVKGGETEVQAAEEARKAAEVKAAAAAAAKVAQEEAEEAARLAAETAAREQAEAEAAAAVQAEAEAKAAKEKAEAEEARLAAEAARLAAEEAAKKASPKPPEKPFNLNAKSSKPKATNTGEPGEAVEGPKKSNSLDTELAQAIAKRAAAKAKSTGDTTTSSPDSTNSGGTKPEGSTPAAEPSTTEKPADPTPATGKSSAAPTTPPTESAPTTLVADLVALPPATTTETAQARLAVLKAPTENSAWVDIRAYFVEILKLEKAVKDHSIIDVTLPAALATSQLLSSILQSKQKIQSGSEQQVKVCVEMLTHSTELLKEMVANFDQGPTSMSCAEALHKSYKIFYQSIPNYLVKKVTSNHSNGARAAYELCNIDWKNFTLMNMDPIKSTSSTKDNNFIHALSVLNRYNVDKKVPNYKDKEIKYSTSIYTGNDKYAFNSASKDNQPVHDKLKMFLIENSLEMRNLSMYMKHTSTATTSS